MPYNSTGRVVHDADAHIMETPTWLRDHADPAIRDRIEPLRYPGGNELRQTGDPDEQLRDLDAAFDRLAERHRSDEYRAVEAAEIMLRKNFAATGVVPRRGPAAGPRPARLRQPARVQHVPQPSAARLGARAATSSSPYGAARAHNRGMVEFCSVDPRLLPTCYVPLRRLRPARPRWPTRRSRWARPRCSSRRAARPATRRATSASTRCGPQAQEAGIPIVFHVGGTGDLIDPNYFRNGLPIPPDFHGGEENFRSVDYMGIPGPPAQTLATMIFDGVLERFPTLRIGVIEQGAIWVPSWMRQMESAFDAFARHEERLQALSMRPSEYVRRQIRCTPYPTEDVGWIIEQAGPEVCLFSSDYPHVEGGRRPIERFEASLGDASDDGRGSASTATTSST